MTTKTVSLPKGAQYHWDYCSKDISNMIRIKCAECNDFDLCVECYSVGVEIKSHKNDHDYYVKDPLNFPIFTEEWSASEELLLLEGIELFGMGNWDDIVDYVATKTAPQCSEHYFSTYIDIPTNPLPDMTKQFTEEEYERAIERFNTAQPVTATKYS